MHINRERIERVPKDDPFLTGMAARLTGLSTPQVGMPAGQAIGRVVQIGPAGQPVTCAVSRGTFYQPSVAQAVAVQPGWLFGVPLFGGPGGLPLFTPKEVRRFLGRVLRIAAVVVLALLL